MEIEDLVWALVSAGIAVELLVQTGSKEEYQVGIRLRTFGKQLPRDRMILAGGHTFREALEEAVEKARARRWEQLDWGARPWQVANKEWGADQFGLPKPL